MAKLVILRLSVAWAALATICIAAPAAVNVTNNSLLSILGSNADTNNSTQSTTKTSKTMTTLINAGGEQTSRFSVAGFDVSEMPNIELFSALVTCQPDGPNGTVTNNSICQPPQTVDFRNVMVVNGTAMPAMSGARGRLYDVGQLCNTKLTAQLSKPWVAFLDCSGCTLESKLANLASSNAQAVLLYNQAACTWPTPPAIAPMPVASPSSLSASSVPATLTSSAASSAPVLATPTPSGGDNNNNNNNNPAPAPAPAPESPVKGGDGDSGDASDQSVHKHSHSTFSARGVATLGVSTDPPPISSDGSFADGKAMANAKPLLTPPFINFNIPVALADQEVVDYLFKALSGPASLAPVPDELRGLKSLATTTPGTSNMMVKAMDDDDSSNDSTKDADGTNNNNPPPANTDNPPANNNNPPTNNNPPPPSNNNNAPTSTNNTSPDNHTSTELFVTIMPAGADQPSSPNTFWNWPNPVYICLIVIVVLAVLYFALIHIAKPLYEKYRPSTSIETGTWGGGGSRRARQQNGDLSESSSFVENQQQHGGLAAVARIGSEESTLDEKTGQSPFTKDLFTHGQNSGSSLAINTASAVKTTNAPVAMNNRTATATDLQVESMVDGEIMSAGAGVGRGVFILGRDDASMDPTSHRRTSIAGSGSESSTLNCEPVFNEKMVYTPLTTNTATIGMTMPTPADLQEPAQPQYDVNHHEPAGPMSPNYIHTNYAPAPIKVESTITKSNIDLDIDNTATFTAKEDPLSFTLPTSATSASAPANMFDTSEPEPSTPGILQELMAAERRSMDCESTCSRRGSDLFGWAGGLRDAKEENDRQGPSTPGATILSGNLAQTPGSISRTTTPFSATTLAWTTADPNNVVSATATSDFAPGSTSLSQSQSLRRLDRLQDQFVLSLPPRGQKDRSRSSFQDDYRPRSSFQDDVRPSLALLEGRPPRNNSAANHTDRPRTSFQDERRPLRNNSTANYTIDRPRCSFQDERRPLVVDMPSPLSARVISMGAKGGQGLASALYREQRASLDISRQ